MAPVSLLDPQPGEWVCDLCAAPGGKTTQIAGRMAGEGFLLCNEINPKRARILSRNIERMGVGNALVTNEYPGKLADRFAGCFDKVLIDAPCSGEGMFRKEEAAVTDWSQETVEMCARRQQEILASVPQDVAEEFDKISEEDLLEEAEISDAIDEDILEAAEQAVMGKKKGYHVSSAKAHKKTRKVKR
jgi:16S rRNA C967 or C1407 C5-methylase (RsmB/RsmF family)